MPKSTRRRNDLSLATPPVEVLTTLAMTSDPSDNDIARRAFELYCERGREDGHDVDDWLNAECDLRDSRGLLAAEKTVE